MPFSLPPPDRAAFALDPEVAFLNHGSFGAIPRVVLAAQRVWAERIEAQPVAFLWDELEAELLQVAEVVARFVGAAPGNLALIENTSAGIATLLRDRPWRPSDIILTLDHGYPGVAQTVRHQVERHELRWERARLPFPCEGPEAVIAAVHNALRIEPTVVVLDHITSPSGLVLPIAEFVALSRQAGALVFVDGAHAPGQVPLDVPAIGADAYVGNLHKWAFAPRGSAFLWVAPERPRPAPLVPSHGFVSEHLHDRFHWPGTRDFTAWLATPVGLALHRAWGGPALMKDNADRLERGVQALAEAWSVALPTPASLRAALGVVPLPSPLRDRVTTDDQARALSRRLWADHQIEVPILRVGDRPYARLSAQVYVRDSDIDRLAHAIIEVAREP